VNASAVNVSRLDARVLVDEQGLVHRVTIDYAATTPTGQTITTSMSLRITDVGRTDVSEPAWLDDARAAANGSA